MNQFNGRAKGTTYIKIGLSEATGATGRILQQRGIIWIKGTVSPDMWKLIIGSIKLNQYRYRKKLYFGH